MKPQRLSSSSSLSLLSDTDTNTDGVADVVGADVDGGDAVGVDGDAVDAGGVDAVDDDDRDVLEFRNPLSSEIGDMVDDRLIPVRKSKFEVGADADADADTDADADADPDASRVFDRFISFFLQRRNR